MEICCHSGSSGKPSANAAGKNSQRSKIIIIIPSRIVHCSKIVITIRQSLFYVTYIKIQYVQFSFSIVELFQLSSSDSITYYLRETLPSSNKRYLFILAQISRNPRKNLNKKLRDYQNSKEKKYNLLL